MRSLLYGALGLAAGAAFCVTLITNVPHSVTRDTNSANDVNQETTVPQETVNTVNPVNNIATYRVDAKALENYKSKKVIEYGRTNPMLFYTATPVVEEPVDPENPQGSETPSIPDKPSITSTPTDDEYPVDPENPYIDETTDEVDTDMDKAVVEFDWQGYESSYVLPRGYLFGYNTHTKKLNVVDVATLEGDIIFNGKFPVDKEFYNTSSNFGIRTSPFDKTQQEFHKGLDIAAEGINGANVYAILDGVVTQASDNDGYGNYVIIDHGSYSTIYAHLDSFAENLKTGDNVKAGDVLGYVGSTGRSTGPHLHLEFDINGVKLTPKHFMNLMLAR